MGDFFTWETRQMQICVIGLEQDWGDPSVAFPDLLAQAPP